MKYGNYVGRVGALAVALGIGSAIAAPAGIAWATPDTTSDSPSASSHGADGAAPPTAPRTPPPRPTRTSTRRRPTMRPRRAARQVRGSVTRTVQVDDVGHRRGFVDDRRGGARRDGVALGRRPLVDPRQRDDHGRGSRRGCNDGTTGQADVPDVLQPAPRPRRPTTGPARARSGRTPPYRPTPRHGRSRRPSRRPRAATPPPMTTPATSRMSATTPDSRHDRGDPTLGHRGTDRANSLRRRRTQSRRTSRPC